MKSDRWLLPEGIDELLPNEAQVLEELRRRILDLYSTWGYDLVIPPFVEYVESLLTGVGSDLDVQTFKLIDQRNGRLMGVRADMTPQVARIDAHRLRHNTPTRLCYIGTVLRTQSDEFASSRSLVQIGAELYGHFGNESDVEMLSLMLETLTLAGLQDVYIDIGHVGVFQGLAAQAGLTQDQKNDLFDALQRKSVPEINEYLASLSMENNVRQMLMELAWLNGDISVLKEARKKLKDATGDVQQAINDMEQVAEQVQNRYPQISLHCDLAEVRGIQYHTGIVFAAYKAGVGQSIAQGGRYDNIGRFFGRARPATGFSADLRSLIKLGTLTSEQKNGIFAPAENDPELQQALQQKIKELRQSGERVIVQLSGQSGDAKDLSCDRELVSRSGQWIIETTK
ncbi:MAG: ATP phosphoribosyltransferase regulatory subunit [Gammaproteobacteria bacterium SG8_11]|nr:MAG: ATP phosphoribosyltransferase regulatory subunit [Gammaproteobacteria bacterium SG8_11]